MSDSSPGTVAHPAPLSMEFSRQEYWSGLLFPSLEDLPNPGIEPGSTTLQMNSLPTEQAPLNFMAVVTICSDFGAQENKVCHCFHFPPSICHEGMGLDAIILVL